MLVPPERFELSRPFGHWDLNPARLPFRQGGIMFGAGKKDRTPDLSITKRALCQLSYTGKHVRGTFWVAPRYRLRITVYH